MTGGYRPSTTAKPRACAFCGQVFTPYRDSTDTCSRACRERLRGARGSIAPVALRTFTCQRCGRESQRLAAANAAPLLKWCVDCMPEVEREAQERKNVARRLENHPDPERRKRMNMAANLRQVHGMDIDTYERMLAEQDGKCFLCGRTPEPGGRKAASRLHVDHDHRTGRIRRLLCHVCNRGLGYLQDDPDLLRAAADYIESWR